MKTGRFLRVLLVAWWVAAAAFAGRSADARTVVIDYFFEPGCSECERVASDVLPRLEARCGGQYLLNRWDVGVETNYLRLVEYLARLGSDENAHVIMVVDGRYLLAGYPKIAADLLGTVERCLSGEGEAPGRSPPPAPAATPRATLAEQMRRFTLVGVTLGGLADGINPCAISTLVFFISLLSMSRVRKRQLLAAGLAFCAASYVTYFAIGFGLLRVLHLFAGFTMLQRGVDILMIVVLLAFAALSFRDAMRYRASRNPEDVTLQLPAGIKRRIHERMRKGLRTRGMVTAGLTIGAAVTVLESVCTGQVYVPTMVYVVKSGDNVWRGLAYLAVYNLAFILPLVVVFILTYQGLKLQQLMAWSMKNVVISKVLLGFFFLLMAGLIAIL